MNSNGRKPSPPFGAFYETTLEKIEAAGIDMEAMGKKAKLLLSSPD